MNVSRQSSCQCGRPVGQAAATGPVSCWVGEFVLDNDPGAIAEIVFQLQGEIAILELPEQDVVGLGIAVEEALVNSIHHGNLELSSELRELDHLAVCEAIAQRRQEEPFCRRRVRLQASICPHEVVLVIRDQGRGFSVADVADPRDDINLDRIGGRGILLMREYMDEVHYNDRGNEVRLVKRRIAKQNRDCQEHAQ